MTKTVKYRGIEVTAVEKLRGRAYTFSFMSRNMSTKSPLTPKNYSWDDFYSALKKKSSLLGNCDLFKISKNGVENVVIPTQNGLMVWKGRIIQNV